MSEQLQSNVETREDEDLVMSQIANAMGVLALLHRIITHFWGLSETADKIWYVSLPVLFYLVPHLTKKLHELDKLRLSSIFSAVSAVYYFSNPAIEIELVAKLTLITLGVSLACECRLGKLSWAILLLVIPFMGAGLFVEFDKKGIFTGIFWPFISAILMYRPLRNLLSQLKPERPLRVLVSLACIVFLALSFKIFVLSAPRDAHHWSYFLGPVNAVLAGANLMWDTPSQYGFLNILAIAKTSQIMHLPSEWAFYLVLMVLQILLMMTLVYVFNKRIALGFTVSCIFGAVLAFMLPGLLLKIRGPLYYPSVGAIRFLPAFAAVMCMTWYQENGNSIVNKRLFIAIGIGAIAILWSVGNMAFLLCSFAFAFLGTWSDAGVKKQKILQLSIALLGSTSLAMIVYTLYSYVRVNDVDFFSYLEYALRYNDNVGTIPIRADYTSLLLLGTFSMFYFLGHSQAKQEIFRVRNSALFGFIFGVGLYFLGRSHPNNMLNILPWLLLSVGFMELSSSGQRLRLVFLGILASFCFAGAMNAVSQNKAEVLRRLHSSLDRRLVTYDLLDSRIVKFLDTILVDNSVPITLMTRDGLLTERGKYLIHGMSLSPYRHFSLLHTKRQSEYLERTMRRIPSSIVVCGKEVSCFESGPFKRTVLGYISDVQATIIRLEAL